MATASTCPTLEIVSLNVASSQRDEQMLPLSKRLPLICQLLRTELDKKPFSVLCLQEVRPTGDLSANDVCLAVCKALGKEWDFYNQKVNASSSAFYRTILWNSSVWYHQESNVTWVPNTVKPEFCYAYVASTFAEANSKTNKSCFTVINVQAPPVSLPERSRYWHAVCQDIASIESTPVFAIGDLNKFTEDHDEYHTILADYSLYDPVRKPESEDTREGPTVKTVTCVSFPHDTDPQYNPRRSCLDGLILCPSLLREVSVVSTEDEPRPTDHYLIRATVDLDM